MEKPGPDTHPFEGLHTIIYSFGDSSVPPPHHRSYDIRVTQTEINVVVDSYGDIISDTTFPTKSGDWVSLLPFLPELPPPASIYEEGITGTTSDTIQLLGTGGSLYQLSWDNRSDDKVRQSAHDLVGAVKSLVPNLSELKRGED